MGKISPFSNGLSNNSLVRCTLCPHTCHIGLEQTGRCGTRKNVDGQLEVLTYGRLAAVAVDPIEKKPLNHFMPGTSTFSVGTEGCNLICPFCQNAALSQCPLAKHYDATRVRSWTPLELVEMAGHHNCGSMAFTYSEPILSIEFALDVAPLAQAANLPILFVTNGQINPDPLDRLRPHLAAANVDLKSASGDTYKKILKGDLAATVQTIDTLHRGGTWVEVTTLIVPGMNSTSGELEKMARLIADISVDIPWHVSRFHPAYKVTDVAATADSTIENAIEIGISTGLRYVYAGNMPGKQGENTCCPNCKSVVVDRTGFRVNRIRTKQSRCPECGYLIAGVGLP
ncbi:MAG: AmmeMemoRadiSam system radical SAM enzyme [Deltaproteobacteria bacterium]|nr:AmmeMemoRadiSam system radical SAM enzyme [Deltaproteobacteria bacterium]